jgi:hypothetical protein
MTVQQSRFRDKKDDAKKEAERQQLLHDYKETFKTPHGLRVLDDILSKGHFYHTTFTGDNSTYFKEGRRDLALYVLKVVNSADSNIVTEILRENQRLSIERDSRG